MSFFRSLFFFILLLPLNLAGRIFYEVGPEICYFQRDKEGGTWQSGRLDGIRLRLERMAPFRFYIGFDSFFGEGELKGKSASGRPLVSNLGDCIFEGRLGYTIPNRRSYIIPYVGYGYFQEKNTFRPPSRLPCTYNDTFNYTLIGFLTSLNFTPLLSMGINFETKFMINGTSKVTDDPIFDDVTLKMNNELQARVEIPVIYNLGQCFDAQVVPFYEFRHFGGREDFPFDFIDTKFHLIGLRFAIGGRF